MKPALVALTSLVLTAAPSPETRPAAPLAVPPKARAYTVDTASVTGAAVLRPGDHVDLIAVPRDDKCPVGVTLLQNVIVVANASPAPGEPRQLSLLVIPEEAELLAVAKAAGHLTATLRNEQDLDLLAEPAAPSKEPKK